VRTHRSFVAATIVLAGALLLSLGAAVSAPAADSPTVCTQDQKLHGEISGPITVPPGITCYLIGGAADGLVSVGSGAEFSAVNTTLQSGGVAGAGAAFSVSHSVVHGSIQLSEAISVQAYFSTVTGSVTGTLGPLPNNSGGASFTSSTVQGRVALIGDGVRAEVLATDTTVGEGMRLENTGPWLARDQIGRYLVLADPGAVTDKPDVTTDICATTVHGDLSVHGANGPVRLGDGDLCGLPSPNTIDGSLLLFDNHTTLTQVSGPISGDAVCRGNTPHPEPGPSGVTVAGQRIQNCAGFAAN
jgi:hypothetical protein